MFVNCCPLSDEVPVWQLHFHSPLKSFPIISNFTARKNKRKRVVVFLLWHVGQRGCHLQGTRSRVLRLFLAKHPVQFFSSFKPKPRSSSVSYLLALQLQLQPSLHFLWSSASLSYFRCVCHPLPPSLSYTHTHTHTFDHGVVGFCV